MRAARPSAVGKIYNEFPDRVADSLLIAAAAGYACGSPWLGWLGALLAALTAYIRVFGGLSISRRISGGPFLAKQQRMALLTVACVAAAAETWWYP